MVFVDSSALLTIFNANEATHPAALKVWNELLLNDTALFTTSYVLLETAGLVQRRIGLDALRSLQEEITPALQTDWVTAEEHDRGVEAVLFAGRRKLSLVDCVSFRAMRRHHITTAFTFDDHFREQGFTLVP
jgi:uncharacterized protein